MIHLAFRLFKYVLFFSFGIAIVCLLSAGFGIFHFIAVALPTIGEWLLRFTLLACCVAATGMVVESIR